MTESNGGRERFVMYPLWLSRTKLSPATRQTYVVLLSFTRPDRDVVWPSIRTIAEEAGVGTTVAKRSVNILIGAGLIEIASRTSRFNRYRVRELTAEEIQSVCRLSKDDLDAFATRRERWTDSDHQTDVMDGFRPSDGRIPTTRWTDSVHEVEEEKKTQEPNEDGLAGRATARTPEQSGSQGGQGLLAGSGGPPTGPAGPAGSPAGPSGSPAGPPSGTPAGQPPGPTTPVSLEANSKRLCSSINSVNSKSERYKRPLADPNREQFQVRRLADEAMQKLNIPERKREHTLVTARYLIDHDGRDLDEILQVIRRVVLDARWSGVTNLYMVRQNYAEILADITNGTEPRRKKPIPRRTAKKATGQSLHCSAEDRERPIPPTARRIEI